MIHLIMFGVCYNQDLALTHKLLTSGAVCWGTFCRGPPRYKTTSASSLLQIIAFMHNLGFKATHLLKLQSYIQRLKFTNWNGTSIYDLCYDATNLSTLFVAYSKCGSASARQA